MDTIINVIINIFFYMLIPVAIRFVILRRPINNKWTAIGILVPIFIGFSIFINIQREEAQQRIYQKLGMQYKSGTHMIGSPMLYGAMIASYFILRGKRKENADSQISSTASLEETINTPHECPYCKAELLSGQVYCHECGKKAVKDNKNAG